MADDVEPISFKAHAEKALAALKESFRRRMEPREKSRAQTVAELQVLVARGHRIQGFIESTIWTSDIYPLISTEAARAEMKPWRPGHPISLEAFHAEFMFVSGKSFILTFIIDAMKDWVRQGKEAAKQLEYENSKKKVDAR